MPLRTDLLDDALLEEKNIVLESIATEYVSEYLADFPKQVYLDVGERVHAPKEPKDIDGFFELVARVVLQQQINEGVAEKHRVKVIQEFQPDDITTEVITFGLLRKVLGTVSKGQAMNQDVREVKPHIRGIEDDPTKPGMKTIVYGQKFDHEVVFNIWAKTNKRANELAKWFERTMLVWRWYILYNGIEQYYFMERGEDITLQLENTPNFIHSRPIKFFVRTESLQHILETELRKVIIQYIVDARGLLE